MANLQVDPDPILDAFYLAHEIEELIREEPEFRSEYELTIAQLKEFACDMLGNFLISYLCFAKCFV